MQYRRLGHSGLKVSELSFGSWVTYGSQVDTKSAVECMAAAWDAGVNFFDNAEVYARGMSETITDVSPETVANTFALYGVRRMIHGHTHRPAVHDEAHGCTRIVLGDWYTQGSVLRVDADGFQLAALPV